MPQPVLSRQDRLTSMAPLSLPPKVRQAILALLLCFLALTLEMDALCWIDPSGGVCRW